MIKIYKNKVISKYKLEANLSFLCSNYNSLLLNFSNKIKYYSYDGSIKTHIEKYVDDPQKFKYEISNNGWVRKKEDHDITTAWIISTDKLDPVDYMNSHMEVTDHDRITRLYFNHRRHLDFCHEARSVLSEQSTLSMNDGSYQNTHSIEFRNLLKEYENFLNAKINYPQRLILPTLRQRFMIHSHMMNNSAYIYDMTNIFDRVPNFKTCLIMEDVDNIRISEDLSIKDNIKISLIADTN